MKDDLGLIISAVQFIEANLKDKLSLEDIASEVGFSKYYFTRLFVRYSGQSPYDYYRGRKLTETINYMKERNCKIIEAAYEYGFSSPEVFARACRSVFGMSPSSLRQLVSQDAFVGIKPISEAYLWFVNQYKLEPSLQILDPIELVGVGYFAPSLYESLYNMPLQQRKDLGQASGGQLFKVTWLQRQRMGYMNFVGKPSRKVSETEAVLVKHLPKMAYLVFDFNIGKSELEYFYDYIYNDYLPASPYELLTSLQLELYYIEGSRNMSKLYIPVIP